MFWIWIESISFGYYYALWYLPVRLSEDPSQMVTDLKPTFSGFLYNTDVLGKVYQNKSCG